MAATLVEGRKYGLDSNDSTGGSKTFIHFKLTDSALRALEEFSRIKVGCSRKPTIQFKTMGGVMNIPGQVSSDDPKGERSFELTLANIHGDANGSFDCVQQTRTKFGNGLKCLGSMQYKVNTHANNDVYSDTRKKIAIADNESRKFCAKEIKMSGRFSGKKIKKVIPSNQYKSLNPGKPTSLPSARPSASSLSSSSSSTPSQSSFSTSSSRLTPPPSSTASPHHVVSDSRSSAGKTASMLCSNNGILKIGNSSGNRTSQAVALPYRERVIHLLAIRSYKKPELKYKLMKDGIHEKDRDTLGAVLQDISVQNKDDSYSLARHAWQYVRTDWPLYTDAEKITAKRNQQLAESRSSTSPPSVSPAVQPTNSPSPPQKRASGESSDVIPSKKKRIAHQDKHHSSRPNGTLSSTNKNNHHDNNHRASSGLLANGHCATDPAPTLTSGKRHFAIESAPVLTSGSGHCATDPAPTLTNGSGHCATSMLTSGNAHCAVNRARTLTNGVITNGVSNGVSDKDSPLSDSPSSNCENQGRGDGQDSSPDYVMQYSKIENCDQRNRYKGDFNREYAEYRFLHGKVQHISERFEHLKERINNTVEGSQDYEALRNKVVEEYKHHKKDKQFVRHKERVDYLHGKLGYIKRLIMDYDRDYHPTKCS